MNDRESGYRIKRYTGRTSKVANFRVNGFIHLWLLRGNPFWPALIVLGLAFSAAGLEPLCSRSETDPPLKLALLPLRWRPRLIEAGCE